ncbi:hypothetical protein GCM10009868_18280 [Terrabacter aerolatus]|uniref:Uncharacterized protein n=1 Tax=Terrabacter aerolatus TaxID=422442 RepID=A0A512CZS1_9MICO|nr:hypothetical protein TAE01_15090 [Terrabacter aerolatus]
MNVDPIYTFGGVASDAVALGDLASGVVGEAGEHLDVVSASRKSSRQDAGQSRGTRLGVEPLGEEPNAQGLTPSPMVLAC